MSRCVVVQHLDWRVFHSDWFLCLWWCSSKWTCCSPTPAGALLWQIPYGTQHLAAVWQCQQERMQGFEELPPVNQIISMPTSCFWLVFVSSRRGKKKLYPKLPGVLLVCLFWNQTVIFIVYPKRRHCYINPLASCTFRLATVVTVNSQVVVWWCRNRDIQYAYATACLSNHIQTWFMRWILCIFVFRQMSIKCMHCIL